jgi:peptidoglycan/xylan/chitin deacetylase (PgdA/CDA1 family)
MKPITWWFTAAALTLASAASAAGGRPPSTASALATPARHHASWHKRSAGPRRQAARRAGRAATAGPPGQEGPAGPPARLPDGTIAEPPSLRLASTKGCPKPHYGAFGYAPREDSVPKGAKTVALTFDDGPGRSTHAILKILTADHIPATFFNIGENVPARPWLLRTEARRGFMLGNHTWNHPSMPGLSAAGQRAQMDRMTAEQRRVVHTSPCAFRPPYGSYDSTTLRLAQHRHMKVWLWSVDTEDWKADGSGSSYWVNRIVRLAEQEGGPLRHPVVLMHNQPAGNPATVRALPGIIRFFRRHHYHFVDLAGHTGTP